MNIPGNNRVSLLLVDDEARNLDVLESILQVPDYRLVRAQNADEALHALVSESFAAIVLDVRMPDMSGLELAQLIKQRKKTQHLPILFLTAYFQEDAQIMQGYGAGAVDYLSKPVNPDILRSKVAVFAELFRKGRALEAEVEVRRAAEQRVRDLNDQLALRVTELGAANAELESFSYTVSHDLRAPLRQVVGFANSLQKTAGDRLDPRADEYIPLIQDAATRMGHLIDDLLEFSGLGRGSVHYGPVQLQSLAEQACQVLQPAIAGRIVHWKIGPLPEVQGDAALLRQVLMNLLDNALKFTRPRAAAEIAVGCASTPHECIVSVADNGVGFDDQHAERLFGVFQRLHGRAEFEGTGIGLASVRRIIQRHGGRTWAASRLGHGTTVFFTLPADPTAPAPAAMPVLTR